MAHSTPAQATTASSTASGNGSSSSFNSSGAQAKTVASTILKRHVDQRQRFDSADYALIQSANSQQQKRRYKPSDEQEPEPEAMKTEDTAPPSPSRLAIDTLSLNRNVATDTSVYPKQHVRRIRLQRFDSADWVMDAVATSKVARLSLHSSPRSSSSAAATASTQAAVAKLILDRHAYTTCHFVTTPVDKHQRCAEKA